MHDDIVMQPQVVAEPQHQPAAAARRCLRGRHCRHVALLALVALLERDPEGIARADLQAAGGFSAP